MAYEFANVFDLFHLMGFYYWHKFGLLQPIFVADKSWVVEQKSFDFGLLYLKFNR